MTANEVWRVTNLQVLDMNLSHDVGQSPPLLDHLVPTRFYQPLNLSKGERGGGNKQKIETRVDRGLRTSEEGKEEKEVEKGWGRGVKSNR